jgi:hypothetical protein
MPISYQMRPLVGLLDKISDPSFNRVSAKRQFNKALQDICKEKGCKVPKEDPPLPPPAYLKLERSPAIGKSYGGAPYEWNSNDPTMELRKVMMRSGWNIDAIQLVLGDGGKNTVMGPRVGGYMGQDSEWAVPDGDYVSQVELTYSNTRLFSLKFITKQGKMSPLFGTAKGAYYMLEIP